MFEEIKYYFLTTYRRKALDKALNEYQYLFKGNVLDIGGGKKDGKFKHPRTKKWIVVDIDKKTKPDIVASVAKLPFKDESFDTVKATELFEHVDNYEKGFSECVRVLKKRGHLIISSPFMYPLHPDPNDYQRVGREKWESLAKINKLKIEIFEEQGFPDHVHFVGADSEERIVLLLRRHAITNIPWILLRYPLYLLFPFFDLLTYLDSTILVQNSKFLKSYVCGYFIFFKKS